MNETPDTAARLSSPKSAPAAGQAAPPRATSDTYLRGWLDAEDAYNRLAHAVNGGRAGQLVPYRNGAYLAMVGEVGRLVRRLKLRDVTPCNAVADLVDAGLSDAMSSGDFG